MIFSFESIVPQGLFRAGTGLREGIARSAATELESTVSGHFYEIPGREYWRRTGDLTEAHPEQPGVVTVSQRGVALHLYGGTVHPGRGDSSKTGQPTKLLAIPADKGGASRRFFDGVPPGAAGLPLLARFAGAA